VDQIEAASAEAGEIVSALEEKSITTNDLVELGAVVSGNSASKEYSYTVFKSVGLAIQDISIANTVYINACKKDFRHFDISLLKIKVKILTYICLS
jgi:ornithine cyclodeaminase